MLGWEHEPRIGPMGPAVPPPPASPALPTAIQVRAALRKIGTPPTAASIRSVLAKGATLTFTAPSAGKLAVAWYQVPAGARVTAAAKAKKRLVVVAKGTRTVTKSGKVKLVVRLSTAGRRLLRKAQNAKRSIRLTSRTELSRSDHRSCLSSPTFLKRAHNGASRRRRDPERTPTDAQR